MGGREGKARRERGTGNMKGGGIVLSYILHKLSSLLEEIDGRSPKVSGYDCFFLFVVVFFCV